MAVATAALLATAGCTTYDGGYYADDGGGYWDRPTISGGTYYQDDYYLRRREAEFEQPYRLAGATAIASSVAPLIDQLMVNIDYPEVKSLMRLGKGNIDVFEVAIPAGAAIVGKAVEAIVQMAGFPATCNFVAVEQTDGQIEVARGTTVVTAGCNVIMLAMEADMRQIIALLTR